MWTCETEPYRSYLLRLWRECQGETTIWRASLESVQSHELLHFATVEELVDFLAAATELSQSGPRS